MHIRSLASVALVAFAAQAFAQQQSKVFKRSIINPSRDLGLMRRDDTDGYQPADEVCNKGGNSCAEACGTGYEQCRSTDQAIHCYNPAAGETCCSTTSGNSCLSSFYCAHDPNSETICCPNGQNLGDCAAKHGVTGALTSDVPVPTTTSTSQAPTSTSEAPTTTSTTSTSFSSSSVVLTTSSSSAVLSTTAFVAATTSFVPSVGTSSAFSIANSTMVSSTRAVSTRVPSATPSSNPVAPNQNAGTNNSPVGLAVILGAAFVALL